MLEDGAQACTGTNVKPLWPMSPGRREQRVAQWNAIGTGKLHYADFNESGEAASFAQTIDHGPV